MSGHRSLADLFVAPFRMTDPASGGTIRVDRDQAVIPVVTGSGAKSLTLAVPVKVGLHARVELDTDGGGDLTLTVTSGYNQAGDTTITFADAGDCAIFESVKVGANYRWRLLGREGTNAPMSLKGRLTTTDGVASGTAKVVGGRSYCQVAAGTAHTNSTDEAVLGSFSIPANTIKQGTVVKVRYQGIATATNAADTLTIVLKCGPTTLTGQALVTHAATDVADNDIFEGEFTLVGRAAPAAAAACVGVGSFSGMGAAGTPTRRAAYLGSTNFATNGALLMEVTADWSAANAGNSCRLDILTVEIL